LEVEHYITTPAYATLCSGSYYILRLRDPVYIAGAYNDTVVYTNTYDSVFITYFDERDSVLLTVFDTFITDELPIVRNGISVTAGGPQAAIYTTNNQYGCDSVVVLNLMVQNIYNIIINDSTCQNELPYTFAGNNYYNSGTYNFNQQSISGCDSNVQLNLTV